MRSKRGIVGVCGIVCIVSMTACRAPNSRVIEMDVDGAGFPLLTAEAFKMTKADVTQYGGAASKREACDFVVAPARIAPGVEITLEPGLEAGVAWGPDERVFYVSTRDARVRYSGLGVGSRYCDVRNKLSAPRIVPWVGYGTLVEIAPCIWLAFGTLDKPLGEQDQAAWIEVRNDL